MPCCLPVSFPSSNTVFGSPHPRSKVASLYQKLPPVKAALPSLPAKAGCVHINLFLFGEAECPGGCRNGGLCNERRVCECPDGFYGPHCEKALCAPRCMNGGLCVTPGFCICPPGFYGVNCDKANCSTTCSNGGTCFYPGKCIFPCLFAFVLISGKCPQPCRNGGKCIGKSKCKCPKGYQGDLCSKPVCEPGCGTHGTCHEPNNCQCQEGWHGRHCNKRYGASLGLAPRAAGARLRQHAPALKKAEERQNPPESNYIW
uniref:WNT inhibitory factor 1 n=1 Tax=Equus asinus TaxID=9793 RepID=A0A9L0K1G0_EQUAS